MAKKPKISRKNRDSICGKLEWEGGLDYLVNGSDFEDIKDPHFHVLREKFVAASKELETYLEYEAYLNNPEDLYK